MYRYFHNIRNLKDRNTSGRISLYDVASVKKFDNLSFSVETTSRSFLLRAETPIELELWLLPLQKYVSERKEWTSRKGAMNTDSYRQN